MKYRIRVYWRDNDSVHGNKDFDSLEVAQEFVKDNNMQNGGYIYFLEPIK